eukprot:5609913-Amphidinium_carterae.1
MVWSFTAMALGTWPAEGPSGQRYAAAGRHQECGFKAAVVEWRGDWKMMAEIVGLPTWNTKAGMCWRCTCTPAQLTQVGLDACWRRPEARLSHSQLVQSLEAKGRLSAIFSLPGFK